MTVTDAQVQKLIKEKQTRTLAESALRSGMDIKTARKYLASKKLPSELKKIRNYRTRKDPFEDDWAWVKLQLEAEPRFESKILFEALQQRSPGRYRDSQLRTLQRRVRDWRAQCGPEREVFFAQQHRPGEAMQLDFTRAKKLDVTIAGEAFEHLLCHVVLPFSNWQSVTVCLSESFIALRRGIQEALFSLGCVPKFVQTDNSTAATHQVGAGRRGFNANYQAMVAHFGLLARTTGIGKKEQNGDIEAANGALKKRIKQELFLRGSSDFDSVETYETWLSELVTRRNETRRSKFLVERTLMRKLNAARLAEFTEQKVRVVNRSTIRVKECIYSVPSPLIGHYVRVRIFERRIEVYHRGVLQLTTTRLLGKKQSKINYRHVIWSLVQKPGAFARYRYREEMFPSPIFRRTYDALSKRGEKDVEYLRVLHLAASTMEAEVAAALELLLQQNETPSAGAVKRLLGTDENTSVPALAILEPRLDEFDELLMEARS